MLMDLQSLSTESALQESADLDRMPVADLLALMNAVDHRAPAAVAAALPQIADAVELIVAARARGGRLIYQGAGTSGRLGLLDAVECPPTFGTEPGDVVGLIAGGQQAAGTAVEGAEDDPLLGAEDLRGIGLRAADVVVGLTASGRTPYVLGGLDHAASVGASTVSVACNVGALVSSHADVAIELDTGPEVLTGSTRLKAGTAQKLVCNMLSTAAMVQGGKVFGNLMIDVRPTNAKLVDRARRIVAAAARTDADTAAAALDAAGGQVKVAVVMLLATCSRETAIDRLARADGRVRPAVDAP
jgi:N-acetylmuramic acid 6-phosphate etherase